MIYLDHNATTPILPAVRDEMARVASATPLNPSSAHSAGARARREIDTARAAVATLIGAEPEQVVFTGSGTESNNAVLWHAVRDGAIVTTTIEHSSVLVAAEWLECRGARVYYVNPDSDGRISPAAVASALDEAASQGPVGVVSVQWVNNETGVIHPIETIAELCRERGIPCHTDAVQAVGKLRVNLAEVPLDYLTLTGHKLHAPAGVGALFTRSRIRPWLYGGEQENGLRAGTENIVGIAGFGAAAALRCQDLIAVREGLAALRDQFEECVLERYPWVRVNGSGPRVANTSNLQFGDLDGEAILAQLDAADIYVSQSSACTNQRPTPSYVLQAMGRTEAEAFASVRFSFGQTNTSDEVEQAAARLSTIVERLSALKAPA